MSGRVGADEVIDFRAILKAYSECDAALARRESNARTEGGRHRIRRLRTLNDYAYFTLLFAQFENHINERCAELIEIKQGSTDWKRRRLWDQVQVKRSGGESRSPDISIPRMQGSQMPFMNRVALLVENTGSTYKRIETLYGYRNRIAHGSTSDISGFALIGIARELRNLKRFLTSR